MYHGEPLVVTNQCGSRMLSNHPSQGLNQETLMSLEKWRLKVFADWDAFINILSSFSVCKVGFGPLTFSTNHCQGLMTTDQSQASELFSKCMFVHVYPVNGSLKFWTEVQEMRSSVTEWKTGFIFYGSIKEAYLWLSVLIFGEMSKFWYASQASFVYEWTFSLQNLYFKFQNQFCTSCLWFELGIKCLF